MWLSHISGYDSYRIDLIPYVQFDEICSRLRGTKRQYV